MHLYHNIDKLAASTIINVLASNRTGQKLIGPSGLVIVCKDK